MSIPTDSRRLNFEFDFRVMPCGLTAMPRIDWETSPEAFSFCWDNLDFYLPPTNEYNFTACQAKHDCFLSLSDLWHLDYILVDGETITEMLKQELTPDHHQARSPTRKMIASGSQR